MINVDQISAGNNVYVDDAQGNSVKIKLMALARSDKLKNPVALAWMGGRSIPPDADVFLSGSRSSIGQTRSLGTLSERAKDFGSLICLIEFERTESATISERTAAAKVSRDISRPAFGHGRVRVSRVASPDDKPKRTRRKHNQEATSSGQKGFVTGDIVNPVIVAKGGDVRLERAAVVRGKSGRTFGRDGDGGTPVISTKGRGLVGFIVAKGPDRTLILPADELVRKLGMQFLTVTEP